MMKRFESQYALAFAYPTSKYPSNGLADENVFRFFPAPRVTKHYHQQRLTIITQHYMVVEGLLVRAAEDERSLRVEYP